MIQISHYISTTFLLTSESKKTLTICSSDILLRFAQVFFWLRRYIIYQNYGYCQNCGYISFKDKSFSRKCVTYLFQDALDTAVGTPTLAGSNADYITSTLVLEKSFSYRRPPIINSLSACLDFFIIQGWANQVNKTCSLNST